VHTHLTTTTRIRRPAALLTCAGVAVDLILTPTAANANVKGDYLVVGQAGARYTGLDPSGDCTLTSARGPTP